jgi:adenine deaminase
VIGFKVAMNSQARINFLPASPSLILALINKKKIYWIPTLVVHQDFINIKNNQKLLQDELLKKIALPGFIDSHKISSYFHDGLYDTDNLFYTVEYQKRHTKSDPINIKKLYQNGAILVTGSDTPERGTFIGWSLHREMYLLVSYGLSPWDALAAATINAGELLGLKFGIEAGAEGNVVVLNASPIADIWNTTKIHQVIHHGVVIHGSHSK